MDQSRARGLILCVDDYENILEGWELLLKSVGYEVLTARDDASALELFTSHSVDEVVLDYQLPGTTGDAVASHMKAINPTYRSSCCRETASYPRKKCKRSTDSCLREDPLQFFSKRSRRC
jgi:CheY-like chemotaxis protein